MTLATVLRIIELLLELAVEATKNMTPDQKQAFLDRHDKRMEFFTTLAERFKEQ